MLRAREWLSQSSSNGSIPAGGAFLRLLGPTQRLHRAWPTGRLRTDLDRLNHSKALSGRWPGAASMLCLLCLGCVAPLDTPMEVDGDPECSMEQDNRYFIMVGSLDNFSTVVTDSAPPPARHIGAEITWQAETAQSSYVASLVNVPTASVGMHPIIREGASAEPGDGVSLIVTLQRPGLGRTDLSFVSGTITFDIAEEDEILAFFDASLGTPADEFRGCFHIDIVQIANE